MGNDLLFREETYRVIGSCVAVRKEKGNGYALKAAKALTDEHRSQVLNYVGVTGLKLGLLVNSGSFPRREWERIVKTA